MSLHFETSPKHCAIHRGGALDGARRLKVNKRLLYSIFTCLLSLLSAAFLIWLVLHPSKPHFYLKEADVYQLSLASPRLLNSTVQFTLVSNNPNAHVGVYYDQLRAYASYRGQQITAQANLPPFYQGHQDTNILSASLSGTAVPVAASFGYEVGRDQMTTGRIVLRVRLDGRIRWKVGSWVSGQYHVDVDCAAVMTVFGGPAGGAAGYAGGGPMSAVQGTQCSTTV